MLIVILLPFNAIILPAGFMTAKSDGNLIVCRTGLLVSFISMMATWAVSADFSRTQMNLSDSIVSVLNEIEPATMPTLVSCKIHKKKQKQIVRTENREYRI